MKLGIIYAGQGSQVVGMGKSFYPREIFDQNEDLKELCFNGPLEKLSIHPTNRGDVNNHYRFIKRMELYLITAGL
ncbi:MAG: hypothetical protein ACLTMR_00350 [Faecalibacillus sp.]